MSQVEEIIVLKDPLSDAAIYRWHHEGKVFVCGHCGAPVTVVPLPMDGRIESVICQRFPRHLQLDQVRDPRSQSESDRQWLEEDLRKRFGPRYGV